MRKLLRLIAPRIHCAVCGCEVDAHAHCICTNCDAPVQNLPLPLQGVSGVAAFAYAEPVRSLIHALKYHNNRYVAEYLAYALSRSLEALGAPPSAVLLPVPLHPARQKERGFNQSALLAQELQHITGQQLAQTALTRVINTASQTHLNAAERAQNLHDAFRSHPIARPAILIDDVCTTGATLLACAQALKKAGCPAVYALTCAHALFEE